MGVRGAGGEQVARDGFGDFRGASCLPAGARIGGCTVTRVLAVGSRHHVSEAQQDGGEPVVLKCIAPNVSDPELWTGLLFEEALLLMRLQHWGIRRCVGIWKQPPAQILEHIDGATLHDLSSLMQRRGHRLSVQDVLCIAEQLVDVLAYMRNLEVRHGDVCTDNILMTRQGRVVLIDFTYGAWPGQRFVRPIQPMPKKLGYNAPEHWSRGQLTSATDMYGMGATLWELLAGRRPRHVRSPKPHKPLPPLLPMRRAAPSVDAELAALVDSMVAVEPAQRPIADAALGTRLEHLRVQLTEG